MDTQYISTRAMKIMARQPRDSKWGNGSRLHYCAVASHIAMHPKLEAQIGRRNVVPMYPNRYFISGS